MSSELIEMEFFMPLHDLKETSKGLIVNIIPFLDLIFIKKHISFEIFQHAFGIKTKVMEECKLFFYKNLILV